MDRNREVPEQDLNAIIFDLDNTLYNEIQFIFGGFKAVARYLASKYGFDVNEIYKTLCLDFIKGVRRKNFDLLLERLGISEDITKLVSIYRNHELRLRPYKDVIVLDILRKKGFRLGLLTDGYPEIQRRKIKTLSLHKFFDVILVTGELGVKKPDIKPFKEILRKLNVQADKAMFVGDNVFKDLIPAKKLGSTTVLILRNIRVQIDPSGIWKDEYSIYVDYVINSLFDLINIVESTYY